jgi:hypothetical protein
VTLHPLLSRTRNPRVAARYEQIYQQRDFHPDPLQGLEMIMHAIEE